MKELIAYRKKLVDDFAAAPRDVELAFRSTARSGRDSAGVFRSPGEVLGELVCMETHVFAPRLLAILEKDQPRFALFEAAPVTSLTLEELLAAYHQQRRQELEWIDSLPALGWNRLGWHPWYGGRSFQWWVEAALHFARQRVDELYESA